MWIAASLGAAILLYASYGIAATPSDPHMRAMTILDRCALPLRRSCSSTVNVNPHGLRPLVLYFRWISILLFTTHSGGSYRIPAMLPPRANRLRAAPS